jgi:hypothetical protein
MHNNQLGIRKDHSVEFGAIHFGYNPFHNWLLWVSQPLDWLSGPELQAATYMAFILLMTYQLAQGLIST